MVRGWRWRREVVVVFRGWVWVRGKERVSRVRRVERNIVDSGVEDVKGC